MGETSEMFGRLISEGDFLILHPDALYPMPRVSITVLPTLICGLEHRSPVLNNLNSSTLQLCKLFVYRN